MSTKTLVISSFVVGLTYIGSAAGQGVRPRLSPHERVDATIDGAALSITYGRPYMRGRVIMGRLVPYGLVWCPGADEATTLTTSKPLRVGASVDDLKVSGRRTVGSVLISAGGYTLWMLPSANQWALIVNAETDVFHTEYSARYDLATLALQKRLVNPPVEQLTFTIENNPTGSGGVIAMVWETTAVSVPFTVVQ